MLVRSVGVEWNYIVAVDDLRRHRHRIQRGKYDINARAVAIRIFRQIPTPRPGAGLPGEQSKHVASDSAEFFSLSKMLLYIGNHLLDDEATIRERVIRVQVLLKFGQEVRVMVGLPADHDAVDLREHVIDLIECLHTTV